MKYLLILLSALSTAAVYAQAPAKTENVILVTFDGYRWQELFTGAQRKLINNKKFVGDAGQLNSRYWAGTPAERRQKLMPFFWGTLAQKGFILGNRKLGSRMNVSNKFRFSYPGYNEIFSGYGDPKINSNDYPDNPNQTIFDLLSARPDFKGRIAAFATWDAFPRIINAKRTGIPVYVNYKCEKGGATCNGTDYSTWQTPVPAANPFCLTDTVTYHFAKEYMQRNHPKFAFIGFDETDEFAHEGKYDAYLNAANNLDRYMKDLWDFIQADPQYKDKTTLIITCDHGRGKLLKSMWRHHGKLVLPAKQIWLAAIGPNIKAKGEIKGGGKYYQKQIAPSIAKITGVEFFTGKKYKQAIPLLTGEE